MSYIYRALQQAELENAGTSALQDPAQATPDLFQLVGDENDWLEQVPTVKPVIRAENRMVTLNDSESLGDEKFRVLRARLLHLQDRAELKKIVITSAVPGEGKTTVASNLAISLARHTAQKVLLLEGDLRQPQLANKFGLPDLRGISEWFEGKELLTQFIYRIESLQLWFLPGGNPADDALKILQSKRFADGLNRLTGCFDWIVVDAPPLMPLADVHLWAEHADGILLVIRNGKTPKKSLLKGLEGLNSAKLLGTVLNDVLPVGGDDYGKYYRAHNRKNGNSKDQSDSTMTQP
jgi:capsular exopolysaccharide synthesis family protein